MCLLCGDVSGASHGIALTERPAHRLTGRMWQGTHRQAAGGAIRAVIAEVKAWADARTVMWRSPLVGLSWNDRTDSFRYLVGIAPEDGEAAPAGFETVELPEMRLASSWHGPDDGDVVAHYGRMIDWLRGEGLSWDTSRFHHREEYPHDVDLTKPPALRLLLPVAET